MLYIGEEGAFSPANMYVQHPRVLDNNIENFGVVYPGYDRGPLFKGQSQITGTNPTDPTYWIRRWRLPGTLELAYNKAEALKVNPRALDTNIWCVPIWWDCASDDEYYNYLK